MDAPQVTLADLASARDDLRTQLKAVQDEEKRLKDLLAENELAIIEQLDAQGVTRSGVGPYSMSISTSIVGTSTTGIRCTPISASTRPSTSCNAGWRTPPTRKCWSRAKRSQALNPSKSVP